MEREEDVVNEPRRALSLPSLTPGLRAAMIVTGLVGAVASSGFARLRDRIVEGRGFNGNQCVGWSMQGSAEECCDAQGGLLNTGPSGQYYAVVVEGPFVPPAMDA